MAWTKTDTGYEMAERGCRLERTGKTWTLTLADGRTFDLGRKASFDHAEQFIQAN